MTTEKEYPEIECLKCGYKTVVHKCQLTKKKLKEDTRCPECSGNKFKEINK